MLDEAGERLRRPRRHHLDAVRVLEITNHADFGQLVLLLLPVRQRKRRIRLEKVARIRGAAVVENQRGLLRREAHAGLFGLENVVHHPRGLNRGVEIRDSAVLVHAERVHVMTELVRRNVLRAEVNAVPRDSENTICDRLTEVVRDDALKVVVRRYGRIIRISDARGRHELELEPFAAAPNHEAAIAVHRTLLRGELHQFLERVPVRHVARLAPCVEILADGLVIVAVPGRRRILVRRQIRAELPRDFTRLGKVLHEVARFVHHDHAVALVLRRLRRLTVLLRSVKSVRARRVILKQRLLHASLQPLQRPGRRDVFERAVEPGLLSDQF